MYGSQGLTPVRWSAVSGALACEAARSQRVLVCGLELHLLEWGPALEAAVAAFRLLPPETGADPALLAHLARESVAWRDGAVSLRFDPACYAARVPVDGWPLLPRITAPTLVVRG